MPVPENWVSGEIPLEKILEEGKNSNSRIRKKGRKKMMMKQDKEMEFWWKKCNRNFKLFFLFSSTMDIHPSIFQNLNDPLNFSFGCISLELYLKSGICDFTIFLDKWMEMVLGVSFLARSFILIVFFVRNV